ncbi:MAG: response regulator transcription factor [Caldilineaceae bacterium]|nr:response regulator transcription factor [Caldilineaceae bacterium]
MKILIVEDDLSLSDVIAFTLRRAGFGILTAYDGLAALSTWEQQRPDLLILDLNLPKLDGLDVCRRVRLVDKTPIIMLSVRGGDEAVVKGLELGADDYIVKPFSPSQLVARVRAVLRRAGVVETPSVLTAATLTLDRSRNEVQRPGEAAIRLTQLEVRLLEMLMLNVGQVLTSDQLITAVWGADGGDRTMLKQLVYRLRTKIETNMGQADLIETIPNVGYTLVNIQAVNE